MATVLERHQTSALVVRIDVMNDDVTGAMAALRRTEKTSALIRVELSAETSGTEDVAPRGRRGWEEQLLRHGFRKHPLSLVVADYEAMEDEDDPTMPLSLQKISAEALARYPLEALRAERNLHMDMLREYGRRSDAHLVRYTLVRELVEPGDVVLDVACGLGYGSAILAAGTGTRRVLGLDNSTYAIEYARMNYGGSRPVTDFQRADAMDLGMIENDGVDVVASFETLEHLAEPEAFLDELKRVLKPGGRAMFSVPNDWTDETGRDPNPFHRHVYTWEKLADQLGARFRITRAFAQIAGGAMKLTHHPRRLREVPVTRPATCEAEWWLMAVEKPA